MDSNEVWARCADCGAELIPSDKQCPQCSSTKKAYERKATATIGLKAVETRVTQKRKEYKEFMLKMISRWKRSRDPSLKGCVGEEVTEEMVLDKEKNWKDHVVRDAKTGKIIHSEHEPLTKHNKKEAE